MSARMGLMLLALTAAVIVPFLLWEESIAGLSEQLLTSADTKWLFATLVVVLLALDVLLPVPSSLVSVAAGAYLGFAIGALACLIGMTAGCVLGYSLGACLGDARIGWIVKPHDRRGVDGFYARYGPSALALTRPVPVLAEVSVVMAGVSGMKLAPMLRYTAAANLGISLAYAAVGHFAMQINSFLLAFFGAMLIPAVILGAVRLAQGRSTVR